MEKEIKTLVVIVLLCQDWCRFKEDYSFWKGISSSQLLLCMIFRTIGKSLINTGAKYQSTVWTGSECGEGSLEVNVPVPARLEVDSISRLILQSCHSGVGI